MSDIADGKPKRPRVVKFDHWTDNIVDDVRRMAADGISTANIAKTLTADHQFDQPPYTKNAVMGICHRRGIALTNNTTGVCGERNGRSKTSRAKFATEPAKVPNRIVTRPIGSFHHPTRSHQKKDRLVVPRVGPEVVMKVESADIWTIQPWCEPVTLEKARVSQCRWPLGSPDSDDFRFCGCPSQVGRSYCPTHFLASRARGTLSERNATQITARIFAGSLPA